MSEKVAKNEPLRQLVKEVLETEHYLERVAGRLKDTLPKKYYKQSVKRLEKLKSLQFPKGGYSDHGNPEYGYMVLINDLSWTIKRPNYLQYIDPKSGSDSTGNQIWALIRNNKIISVMLRKAIQTKDPEHNKKQSRVGHVIDINNAVDLDRLTNPPKKAFMSADDEYAQRRLMRM